MKIHLIILIINLKLLSLNKDLYNYFYNKYFLLIKKNNRENEFNKN